jgi:hypothetical protein
MPPSTMSRPRLRISEQPDHCRLLPWKNSERPEMALAPPDRAASTRGPQAPPPAASWLDAAPPSPPKPVPRGRLPQARSVGQPPPPRARRVAAIRSCCCRCPTPVFIPTKTRSLLRASPRSGQGPAGSRDHTARRRKGKPAPASTAVVPKRPPLPQPTSEERKKATLPPSPRAGRDASDPLWQRCGEGEGESGGGGLGFRGGAVSPERGRLAA